MKNSYDFTPGKQTTQFLKMGKGLEQTLLQEGDTEGPETYENMFSITGHLRDENSNHNEIPLHTTQNGHHK